MKKFLIFSVLYLMTQAVFSQTPQINYVHSNKCAIQGGIQSEIVLTDGSPSQAGITARTWTITGPTPTEVVSYADMGINRTFSHFFNRPGVYTIELAVTWSGSPQTTSTAIEVFPMPEFTIAKSTDTICPGEGITFSYTMLSQPAPTIAQTNWTFGDGGTSTNANPTNTYDNYYNIDQGYQVSLTLTDVNGCVARVDTVDYIFVRSKPEVNFSVDKSYICFAGPPITATVNFINHTDTSAGRSHTTNTYLWKFNDGTGATDNTANPPYTYNASGMYYPTLIATDQFNCTDSFKMKGNGIILKELERTYTFDKTMICELPDTISAVAYPPSGLRFVWHAYSLSGTYGEQMGTSVYFPFKQENILDNGVYNNTHTIYVTAIDIGDANCSVVDTFVFKVYDKIPSIASITDTNECDPGHVINFKNTTVYPFDYDTNTNLGYTNWYFGNGTPPVRGDNRTYTYGTSSVPDNAWFPDDGYGDYQVMMTGVTPYGCPMDTAYQMIHIFRMYAVAMVKDPAPPDPPHGCINFKNDPPSHKVTLANIMDSLVSSSDINTIIWRWDYYGQWNVDDTLTTTAPFLLDGDGNQIQEHPYTDTGRYDVYLTLINEQGCRHDIPVAFIMVGYPPLTNFVFLPDTACKSDINIRVMAYDSVIFVEDGEIIPPGGFYVRAFNDTVWNKSNQPRTAYYNKQVARSKANGWQWLDDQDSPIGGASDTSTISPNTVGEAAVKLVSSHNGCNTEDVFRKEGMGLICPPIAKIDDPAPDPMTGEPPLYCALEDIPSIFQHSSADNGAIYVRWYAGDSYPGADTSNQSKSPIMVYDINSGTYSWDSTGGIIPFTRNNDFSSAGYHYVPGIITQTNTDGNYGFTYDTGSYLTQLAGVVTIRLWAMNDSSVVPVDVWLDTVYTYFLVIPNGDTIEISADIYDFYEMTGEIADYGRIPVGLKTALNTYEPWGNHCGHCAHVAEQEIYISYAKMNFTVSQPNICQGDSVVFFDSTECNVKIFGWGFKFNKAEDPSKSDFPIGEMMPIKNYTGNPRYGRGQKLGFRNTNRYEVVLFDTCGFGCHVTHKGPGRTDTLVFDVFPQSIPAFVTSTDSAFFADRKLDTVCANDGGYIYFVDKSWSPTPFDTAEVVSWNWQLGNVKDTVQNPALRQEIAGLYSVSLSIDNEYGCKKDTVVYDRVLVNNVYVNFNNPGRQCNKTMVHFKNNSDLMPSRYNYSTMLRYIWYWGDGDSTIIYTYAGNPSAADGYHLYDLPDTANNVIVKLKVSLVDDKTKEPLGCENEYVDSLIITRPVAKFTSTESIFACPQTGTGLFGREIQFFNESVGDNIVLLEWSFGDGIVEKGPPTEDKYKEPLHRYEIAGKYDVLLVVQDAGTCRDSLLMKSWVNIAGPQASLTYTPTDGCAPLEVFFTPVVDESNPEYLPDSIVVHTGTGETILLTYPYSWQISLYKTAGQYIPVYYTYKTVVFEDSTHICRIQVTGEDTINAISITPYFDTNALYCPNVPVSFTNLSAWAPQNISMDAHWDYDNGDSTDQQNIPYDTLSRPLGETQFDFSGKFRVTLTMSSGTVCSKSRSLVITVIDLPDLTFTPDSASSCGGKNVTFYANDINKPLDESTILDYEWRFDSTVGIFNTTTNSVDVMFSETGIYDYEVIVRFAPDDSINRCMRTYYGSIFVEVYGSPDADFEVQPEIGIVGETFQFTDLSIQGVGVINRWFWNYDDGNTSPDSLNPNPDYIYTMSGERWVHLVVVDEYGCYDTINKMLTVQESIQFPNIFTPEGVCPKGKCEFRPMEEKGTFAEFRMEVYDKWGMRIWKNHCEDKSNMGTCPDYGDSGFWWDGNNAQGKPVPAGIYYWVIYTASSLSEGKPIVLNGSVTLVR